MTARRAVGGDAVERAQALGPTIAGAVDAIERDRRIPQALMDEMHAAGLMRMLLPRSVGGEEMHPAGYFDVITEIARHDGSLAWNAFVANSSAIIAAFLPLASAREIFADPATLIAWGPPNPCRAHVVEGGYRVTGEWDFASGCRHANWMGAHCLAQHDDGSLALNAAGKPTIRTLLFPAAQAELIDNWDTIGLRGTASDGYRVQDVFVADAFSTTREDPEGRREQGPLYAIPMQGLYAVGVAAVAVGIARAMLSEFIELAQVKTPRGQVRLAESSSIAGVVAKTEAELSAATAWLRQVLGDIYDRVQRTPVSAVGLEDRARVRLACAHAIQSAVGAAEPLYRLAGVSAIFRGSPFERRYRDIHTVSQQIQARPAHFEAVGKILLGDEPAVFF